MAKRRKKGKAKKKGGGCGTLLLIGLGVFGVSGEKAENVTLSLQNRDGHRLISTHRNVRVTLR
jgi:hypothetical protein